MAPPSSILPVNVMNGTNEILQTTWLRTDHPVVSINSSHNNHVRTVAAALHCGLVAIADRNRPGFYDIEIGGNWYYIHIPNRIARVYIVAARGEASKLVPQPVWPCSFGQMPNPRLA